MTPSEREITWFDIEKSEIEKQLHIDRSGLDSIILRFDIGDISFRVYTNEPDFIAQAKSQFYPSNEKKVNELIVLSGASKSDILIPKIDLSRVETPHIGYYDEKTNFALATGKGYGLFKSLLIGFASAIAQERGYHPAHASFIQLGGRGIMFTGSHKAGKTTSLMHVMQSLEGSSPRILTDDWILANENDGMAYALEETVSFSKNFCEEFPYLNLTHLFDKNAAPGIKKVYLQPNLIWGDGCKIDNSRIDQIVLLEPANRSELILYPNREYVVEKFLDGTYHMPDCNPIATKKHREFWMNLLSYTKFISFDTRHQEPLNESYAKLCEQLK